MKKEHAKLILELSPETLIKLWQLTKNEAYLELRKTRTEEEIVQKIREMAKDALEEQATTFEMKDGTTKMVYHGD